ncbi:MAG: GTPase domain-containing protein [Kyrpidia sp.]|nr:GTPase domain-containing protein [Kyrpidia sp.]
MTQGTVVGITAAGKTMFWLQLSALLAGRTLPIRRTDLRGRAVKERVTVEEARRRLCSFGRHKTRDPQWVDMAPRRWHPWVRLRLVDTAGLVADIHPDMQLRRHMGDSLRCLVESAFWFHVVDLGRMAKHDYRLSEVDQAFIEFGCRVPYYVLIGNKCDLPGAGRAAEVLIGHGSGFPVFVVSSLYRTGFTPVVQWLRQACRNSA